jgi:hypothetical protein
MWSFNRKIDAGSITEEELIWCGPYKWPKFESDVSFKLPDICGVYLCTLPFKDSYAVYSAGITNSTKKRFSFHSREYNNGGYNILDVKSAKEGIRKEIWHGWGLGSKEEFIADRDSMLKAIEEFISSFGVYVAKVSDKRKRERIEAAIMEGIYRSTDEPYADLADRGMKLTHRYNYEMPIKIKSIISGKVYGIPEYLEI